MPTLLRSTLLFALCLTAYLGVLEKPAFAASLGCSDSNRGVTDLTTWNNGVIHHTNNFRREHGLVAVKEDPLLSRAAQWKARDMARRSYFSHDDIASENAPARTPWERLLACGYNVPGATRTENIAAGQKSPKSFVDAWINSPSHRANLLNPRLRFIGVATAQYDASRYGTYSVQMFSTQPSSAYKNEGARRRGTSQGQRQLRDIRITPKPLATRFSHLSVAKRSTKHKSGKARTRLTVKATHRTTRGAPVMSSYINVYVITRAGKQIKLGAGRTNRSGQLRLARTIGIKNQNIRAIRAVSPQTKTVRRTSKTVKA